MGKLQACMNDRTFITSSFLACTYVCVYVYAKYFIYTGIKEMRMYSIYVAITTAV
jgi:hypothetical protein